MTIYVFRVWLQPNPLLGFEPDEEVWRDIEINGSHTLAAFHEAIFDAFKRWDSHAYEFITRDKEGIALRSYVHPHLYDGGGAGHRWTTGKSAASSTGLCRTMPRPRPKSDSETFRGTPDGRQRRGHDGRGTRPRTTGRALLHVRYGDGWEHSIDLQEAREGSLDGGPAVVNEQGEAPPQYRDLDDDQ